MTAVLCDNPPAIPEPVGVDQLYSVPDGINPFAPFTGVMLNVIPLQVNAVIAVIVATGLSETTTVNV